MPEANPAISDQRKRSRSANPLSVPRSTRCAYQEGMLTSARRKLPKLRALTARAAPRHGRAYNEIAGSPVRRALVDDSDRRPRWARSGRRPVTQYAVPVFGIAGTAGGSDVDALVKRA